MPSQWATAASTALFGAVPVPFFGSWTPASFYNACQLYLKSLILSLPVLFVIDAPFGRFSLPDSIFRLPGNLAFALMEIPGPIFCILGLLSTNQLSNESYRDPRSFLASLLQPSLSKLKDLPIANVILASLYVIHYTHRAILQPIYGPKRSPSHLAVFASAFVCQLANGFTMGSWLGGRSPALLIPANLLSGKNALKAANPIKTASWFASILPKSKAVTLSPSATVLPLSQAGLLPPGISTLLHPSFVIGVIGWAVFFLLNAYHDEILYDLRRPAKGGNGPAKGTRANSEKADPGSSEKSTPHYDIPEGGLYSFISYPNYFTEWLEWFFFALAALSQTPLSPLKSMSGPPLTTLGRLSLLLAAPPLLFPLMEVAVMLPRAVRGHQWYQGKFGIEGDGKGGRYPKNRRAIIPFVL